MRNPPERRRPCRSSRQHRRPIPCAPAAPAAVYYVNCTAVRAAGKARLYRGEAGYRSGLDRHGDGVAWETCVALSRPGVRQPAQ
ncbi:MAG: excalibur calcium-binding domain-containing protein [Actinomycetota bacterium]|nr:excalibur calcium-binding domain-containing protein [Actinomycetota bacterium]